MHSVQQQQQHSVLMFPVLSITVPCNQCNHATWPVSTSLVTESVLPGPATRTLVTPPRDT